MALTNILAWFLGLTQEKLCYNEFEQEQPILVQEPQPEQKYYNKKGQAEQQLPMLKRVGHTDCDPILAALPLEATAPQKTRRRRDERCDALQNRQKVLQAAQTLFAERSVEAVTMSEIAETAGVGKGTLYRRFAHKGALCQALMEANTRTFQTQVEAEVQTVVLSDFGGCQASPVGRLRLFLTRLIDFTEQNAVFLLAAFEAQCEKGGTTIYAQPAYDWLRTTMVALLREAVAAGECRPALDIDYLADALLAPFGVNLYLYQRQLRGYSAERIRVGLEQLLLGILYS